MVWLAVRNRPDRCRPWQMAVQASERAIELEAVVTMFQELASTHPCAQSARHHAAHIVRHALVAGKGRPGHLALSFHIVIILFRQHIKHRACQPAFFFVSVTLRLVAGAALLRRGPHLARGRAATASSFRRISCGSVSCVVTLPAHQIRIYCADAQVQVGAEMRICNRRANTSSCSGITSDLQHMQSPD